MKVLLISLFMVFSNVASATDIHKRLEAMVQAGSLSPEAAKIQKTMMQQSRPSAEKLRGEAQRGLASIDPALKPLPIRVFRASPLVLFFD
ncbi:MAG: hypothetical protein ACLGG7_01130 [Bacteriovoracia bacterium]